jgi:adenylate cyclase
MAESKTQLRNRLLVTAGICLAWGGLVAQFHFTRTFGKAEAASRDNLIQYGRKAAPDPRLIYLGIDEASIALEIDPQVIAGSLPLGIMKAGFPYSRDLYAHAADRLFAAGAEVVAIDLLFSNPRDGDDALRAALDQHAGKLIIGAHFAEDVTRTFIPPSDSLIASGRPEADPHVGYVIFWPDLDEVVRRVRYKILGRDYFHQNIAPEVADRVYTSFSGRILERLGFAEKLPFGEQMFRFAEINKSFRRESLYTLFVPDDWRTKYADGAFFKGKIVVIGPHGDRFKDQLLTPFGSVNGAELHLDAVNAFLQNAFFVQPSLAGDLCMTALAVAVAFIFAIPSAQPLWRFLALFFVAAVYLGTAVAIANAGLLLPVLAPVVTLLTSGATSQAYQQVLDQIERARTRRTLERYVSRNVVRELLDEPASYLETLGGVRKPVAVLFSDLRGFTSMTEQGDSHQLVAQLNEYFTEMVKIVFENNGTLDKFIGDAVMAVWGNIKSEGPETDVCRCVNAALQMREAVARLNADWRSRGMTALGVGFGINYGEVIVGNIGSTEKMELTVIGDAVNLASRLEGVTKEYAIDMLLGEEAGRLADPAFHLINIDRVQVKGRSRPVEVFAAIARKDAPIAPATEAFIATHHEALRKYRDRDFAGAAERFARCLELDPASRVATLYIERCASLENDPPPPAWDGVFVMTRK